MSQKNHFTGPFLDKIKSETGLQTKRMACAPKLQSLGFNLGIFQNEVWVEFPKIPAKNLHLGRNTQGNLSTFG